MKIAALWLAIVVVTSCSITHRSGDYACTKSAECSADRVCSDGFCVVPNGAVLDAPSSGRDAPGTRPDGPIPNTCPPGCSSCSQDTRVCNIVCGSPGAANCGGPITCPPGWSCNIDCRNQNNCRSGIDCTNSNACNVICSGSGSCRDVVCGAGACTVACTGTASCNRGVDCGASCKCDVACTNPSPETCGQGVTCGPTACDVPGTRGCTSMPAQLCSSTCP